METIGSFDVVTAAYLFVYAETPDALGSMCAAAARHLRPDGRLVATVIHPRLVIEDQMPIEQTGGLVEVVDGGALVDGAPLVVTIGTGDAKYRARDYFWSASTYEASLRDAGFTNVAWHDPVVSDDGMRELGSDFWTEFLRNPTIAVLTALLA